MHQRSTGNKGREAGSGEIRVNGSLTSESGRLRDERPKVGLGRSGQSNNLAPVPGFVQVDEPAKAQSLLLQSQGNLVPASVALHALTRMLSRYLRTTLAQASILDFSERGENVTFSASFHVCQRA
jgi:hypothetical protein